MGKKGRRTRWRTLTITDEHSDSEESNTTTSGHRMPKGYSQKSYYSRFTYSSQSTPTRRYQCDGAKSTRSSSTASETKITFNEDEYTRITTPRQDVLFKKGYLNKPKTYQTQTSTGNSTTSTGNSTGNGTPDHQSTDLEYESQFVFPNGFVDQNGIYYVNSFEPYPVMVYNPPTYYPEYTNVKTKRSSTGSLTESTSPNNEETSQDLSQSETPSNVSELNHVYNVIYPGYYYNGVCQPQDVVCEPEPRRVKKRRRRKLSRSKQEGTTSESSDEIVTDEEETKTDEKSPTSLPTEAPKVDERQVVEEEDETQPKPEVVEAATPSEEKESKEEEQEADAQNAEESDETKKYDLKPDAEEFVPRAYRHHPEAATIPLEVPANVQFIKIPSNFVPLPIMNPMGEFNAFIPPGIPINFIPQNYVNFIPYKPIHQTTEDDKNEEEEEEGEIEEEVKKDETKEATTVEVPNKTGKNQNRIDIAKIVSKLEEAAKEQEDVKEETKINNVRKRHKYQKVELRKPIEEKKWHTNTTHTNKMFNSPKKDDATRTPRNYSETLKKSMAVPQCESYEKNVERTKVNKVETKNMVKNHQRADKTSPKVSSEWISVSRKKRKNKNVEESEEIEEEKTEVLESVQVLEEVEVTPAEVKPKVEVRIEPSAVPAPLQIPEEEEKKNEQKSKTKKKSKKNHAKVAPPVVTKRVMITDRDLSVQEVKKEVEEIQIIEEAKIEEPIQPEPEEVVLAVEESKSPDEQQEVSVDVADVDEKVEEEKIDDKKEPSEKKSKKKKKKNAPKAAILSSQSSSNATLNNVNDDSYDFLMDESLEKTNVEVSQELDKMIQRGMYSSLEEKIKSMNMESSDTFFKTIISNISSRESSVEKNSPYIKTQNLTRLITNPSSTTPTQLKEPRNFLAEPTAPDAADSQVEGGANPAAPRDDHLYPITRAVKEWMTKTRETTPDVEILKSPSAIFKEFCPEEEEEDEEVIFSHERKTSASSSIEEGEDVVETYESKYGRNEDFLKIQAEVEELKNGDYPKHGNLPYRAICCSIM